MTSTQHLFQTPKPTHRLHPFTRQDRLFIVDLDAGKVLETDDLIWEILQLCPESTADEILETLSERYEPELIYQAFAQLRSFEEHEVETVLMHILKDRHSVTGILNRAKGFAQATSL